MIDGEIALACGGGPAEAAFPASALDGGVTPSDATAIEEALDALAVEAGMDAPQPLQGVPASEAGWFVLSETLEVVHVAVGDWSRTNPQEYGDISVTLEREDDSLRAVGWGNCQLMPALADEWTFWANLGAPDATPEATSLDLQVVERSCTGARAPDDFLREPVVVETDEDVTVYWASGYFVGDPPADTDNLGWDCPSNPFVTRTVPLEAPLGDRAVLDGSFWPPRDVRGVDVSDL